MKVTENKTQQSVINRVNLRAKVQDKPIPVSRIERALQCLPVYEKVLEELTINLNYFHKINWNREQYRKLLGNWLLHFIIGIIFSRWEDQHKYNVNDVHDIKVKIQSDYDEIQHYNFNVELNIELLKIIKYVKDKNKIPTILYYAEGNALNHYSIIGYDRKKLMVDLNFNTSYNSVERKEAIEYVTKIGQYGNHVNWKIGEKIKYKINQKWRNKYIGKKIDNFFDLCMSISHIYLPVSFLEGFNPLYKISLLYEFKYIYTSVGTINNIPLKMVAATWHGSSKIFNHQHGGGYGMNKLHLSEIYERSIADNFFTLGWKEDIKTIPLAARPRLIKNSKSSGILIKTKPNHRYLPDFFSESLNQIIIFIKSTKGLNREIAHYSIQPGQKSDNDYFVRLKHKLENATIPDKSKNDALYSLHVLNYMGTSFLESMAADIPTICILDFNYNYYRSAFRKYIDELIEVGIIQPDGQSAADKVNDIYNDIDSWWLDEKLQNIRRKFIQKYARFNSNWLNELCEQFEHIIK